MPPYQVETVLKNIATTVGEGPHYDEATKMLLHVDLQAGNIHRYNTLTKIDEMRHYDAPTTLIVPRQSGGYVIADGLNLSHLNWETGQLTPLASVDQGTRNRFNDGKCDASGRLWAGTMGYMEKPVFPEMETASLYTLEKDLKVRRHLDKITISNGITWTHNNTKMFYTDTITREVWAFDFDLESGNLSNKKVLVKCPESLGYPDGMTADIHENIWLAYYDGSCVVRYDTTTGKEISKIKLPTSQIASCGWGGDNYDELYVTTGHVNVTDDLAGSLFKVTGLESKGRKPHVFLG
ncbi:hypothetical protein LOTGIDRAFT_223508 [Lottia gigantea]|uniref:Regucalcin n=1 Tax=Lottia gigantea TaxID=225164 RepID=V3ZIK3_LOTGI|nr:hypothetical protein LOTGIDRAFT_223508 [Lottia gigantea]ESO82150.1 hypothetical protein LOTGIDRAFT_223508 [Lottia gigantea]